MRVVIKGFAARLLLKHRVNPSRRSRRHGGRRRLERFAYPLNPSPRAALLLAGFRETGTVKFVADPVSLDFHRPNFETIAAPVELLRELAMPGRFLRYPIVAFTGIGHGCLTPTDRELFWRSFGVPVFEQFLGPDGEVLAEECDAHNGLHIRVEEGGFEFKGRELMVRSLSTVQYPNHHLSTGLAAAISNTPCPCGRTTARLCDIEPLHRVLPFRRPA